MPAVAMRPVTSSGVSAANCVAAMLSPAFHPGSVRPARKYSSRFLLAAALARSPASAAEATNVRMMATSSPLTLRGYPPSGARSTRVCW